MTHWEYTTVTINTKRRWAGTGFDVHAFEAQISDLGSEGWELVSMTSLNEVQGRTVEVIAVFKRPKQAHG
jgi:hypothetical protein